MLRIFDKSGTLCKETILQSGKSDPFLVYYKVNKVNLLEDKIEVLGNAGAFEKTYQII